MDKKIIAIIAVIILLAAGVAAYIVATGNGEKAPKKALGSGTDVTVPIYGNANNDTYPTAIASLKATDNTDKEAYGNVYSINGQIVRRGTTSLEGLPKGLYVVNGKIVSVR